MNLKIKLNFILNKDISFSLIELIAKQSDLGNISSDKLYSVFPSNLQKSFNCISLLGSSIE